MNTVTGEYDKKNLQKSANKINGYMSESQIDEQSCHW
jgi:hypothetical protein